MEGLELNFDPASGPICVCELKRPYMFIITGPWIFGCENNL